MIPVHGNGSSGPARGRVEPGCPKSHVAANTQKLDLPIGRVLLGACWQPMIQGGGCLAQHRCNQVF